MVEWRVLIADDEPLARRGVRQLLAPHGQFVVTAECRDGLEVEQALRRTPVDVVVRDIEMPGSSGLEVAERWSASGGPAVVFLTAHATHALAAFEAAAVDYLVKPVSAARFARTIARLTARLALRRTTERGPALLVTSGQTTVLLPIAEVEWIAAANHASICHSGGQRYLLREALESVATRLEAHGFLRAHRGALVRREAIRAIKRHRDGTMQVQLVSGATVTVARRRAAAFAAGVALQG